MIVCVLDLCSVSLGTSELEATRTHLCSRNLSTVKILQFDWLRYQSFGF